MTSPDDPERPPRGLRVFVVEDEPMIGMLLEDMLDELGCTVAASAARLDEALTAARTGEFDVALLDVNLHDGENSYRAADVLTKRGIPFALMTAYDGSQLARYGDHPLLQKPFDRGELGACVRHLLESAPANPAP